MRSVINTIMAINTNTNDLLKHKNKYYSVKRLKEFLSVDKKISFEIGINHSSEVILVYKSKTTNGTARFLPVEAEELANGKVFLFSGIKQVWNKKLKIYEDKKVYKEVKNVYEF